MIFSVRIAWSMGLIANVLSIAVGHRGDAGAAQALFTVAIAGFTVGGLRFVEARNAAGSDSSDLGSD